MSPELEDRIRQAALRFADELLEALRAATPAAPAPPDRLLSLKAAGEALGGLARSTVHELVRTGRLPSVQIANRRRMIRESDLAAYIAAQGDRGS